MMKPHVALGAIWLFVVATVVIVVVWNDGLLVERDQQWSRSADGHLVGQHPAIVKPMDDVHRDVKTVLIWSPHKQTCFLIVTLSPEGVFAPWDRPRNRAGIIAGTGFVNVSNEWCEGNNILD